MFVKIQNKDKQHNVQYEPLEIVKSLKYLGFEVPIIIDGILYMLGLHEFRKFKI